MFYNLKIKYLKNMKKYAIQENIPIIPEETGIFLENFINTKKIVDILEIGTAVGYSALTMCNPTNRIQTLERSKIYYQLAKKIFSHTPFNIEVIWTEALIYQPKKDYDLIFIDGAKSQYCKLFEKYQKFIKNNGFIICDNLNFHNLFNKQNNSKNVCKILKKIQAFKIYLKINYFFKTTFINVGDGLSISCKNFLPSEYIYFNDKINYPN
ncbi:MAG: hypothetical protein Q8821_01925 [Sweet potato little leaf phytoplasma]|nr:hypothetical protein [Sweet potato little leaf phytoplasma]